MAIFKQDIAFITHKLWEDIFSLWLERFKSYVWGLQKPPKEGVQLGLSSYQGVNNTTTKCLLLHQPEKKN